MKERKNVGKTERERDLAAMVEAEALIQSVASLVFEMMESEGLDKAQLAERLATSRANVTQLLRGDRNMTLRTVAELAHTLGFRLVVSKERLARPTVRKERWPQGSQVEYGRQKLRVSV